MSEMPAYSTDRRGALKIIGAIGANCAYPFAGDELHGQTVPETGPQTDTGHHNAAAPSPTFFRERDFATLSRVSDLIIPPTATAGAIQAGVPLYIDRVISTSSAHQELVADGLRYIDAEAQRLHSQSNFLALSEVQQLAMLEALCQAYDRDPDSNQLPRPVQFFGLIKSLTADGYYTSQPGLIDELGYKGNNALSSFPGCREH
jgi:gluconate 2-dehydrogenase gamma chain